MTRHDEQELSPHQATSEAEVETSAVSPYAALSHLPQLDGVRAIAILFVLGFPVAVFLAWIFDVDRHGVRRADPASGLGKGVIALSITGLLLVTGVLSYLLLPSPNA